LKNGKGRPAKRISDDVLSWLVAGACLCVAVLFDKHGPEHRWHAAIAWTGIPFGSVVSLCRDRWGSSEFWVTWLALLCGHIGLMWLVFSYLFPSAFIGIFYIIPLAFLETYLVLMCVSPKWRIHF
jgi:hypothetical protein